MASYIDLNDLGSFANIEALWAAYPEGGQEGDYCTIDGVKYRWDKYDRMWIADPNFGPTPARNVDTFYGDVNIHNNLTVAGTLRAKGINNPCVGFFPSEEALEEKWPTPKVGWWAIVGDTIPGEIYHCVTEGEWTDSGETGGSGEVDLTEYAKLTDIPEIADDLVTNSGTKVLSARQGKILNEKIPSVVDNLTSTSATSALSAKQGKVLNEKIPAVVDNLTTSSPISALSAKQGKILKTLIDNIGSINVQGIQGFWPIDSLDDLPLSPTLEQKRQAYLYENALYIYVGEGGDTLDGKYKSTQLVTLDWNDKAYAPSIYNGLGRTTLKKNMVEGVNVLTSAMIGTNNTEYFIQYDYDLGGATVTLPANASLVFMGGSIKNGTLIGNNTRIQAKRGVCIFDNITIQGTWDVAEAYSSWLKTYKAGYKIASVTEDVITLRRGNDGNYYEMEDLTYKSGPYYAYYVTSTLVDGEVVESSIKVTVTTYATFKVEGDDTDYLAAPSLPADVFEEAGYPQFDVLGYAQYDDTAALQSLFDIRAKKTVVEDGIYMVKGNTRSGLGYSDNVALLFEGNTDCELVLEGWLKVIPNSLSNCYILNIIGCKNVRVSGNGGIHGDLLEHTDTLGEGGMLLAVSNTNGLVVSNLTFAYTWGDCIYCHWWRHGRIASGNDQKFHTFNKVKIIYGGRTGLVYERGDNVVVDSCYFMGSGRVRGKDTNSAVDIEPFSSADTAQRYVTNYEFKNNVFEKSANGLRLERCINCSIHDNYFDGCWTGVYVISHKDVSYNITSKYDWGYKKGYMKIYNNHLKRCGTAAIELARLTESNNVAVFGNTIISCSTPISAWQTLYNSQIYNNVLYGCGRWEFSSVVDCDIYGNRSHGSKMYTTGGTGVNGGEGLLYIKAFASCERSKFHDNYFSLDYGKSMYGLGADGKEELYHGLPLGPKQKLVIGASLTAPSKVKFCENVVSDDMIIYYGTTYYGADQFLGNNHFEDGMSSVRNESSGVFLKGDVFRSSTYGDEGIVVDGGMISSPWLEDATDFEEGLEVVYGQIVNIGGGLYKICIGAGTCGSTLTELQVDCGTAKFISLAGHLPDTASQNRIKICFTKPGICTSSSRPDSFLYAGRMMHESDTGKDIRYDGTSWEEINQ